MNFGFLSFWTAKLNESQAEGAVANYKEIEALDELGWDSVWVGGVPLGSNVSHPLVLASAIAARTSRVKIGTAVHLPGLKAPGEEYEKEVAKGGSTIERRGPSFDRYKYVFDYMSSADPLQTAEQIGMVDYLSDGRFIYGAGGGTAGDEKRQEHFFEFLTVVKQALTEEEFSGFDGKYYKYPPFPAGARLMPEAVQKPHPPILLPLDSQQGFVPMGKMGYRIAIGGGSMHNERGDAILKEDVKSYRQAWRDAGHPGEANVTVRMNLYVAPTKSEFVRNMEAGIKESNKRRVARGLPANHASASDPSPDLYGTPTEVIDRIYYLKEEFGADEIMCPILLGLPRKKILETMKLFSEEVMPEFK